MSGDRLAHIEAAPTFENPPQAHAPGLWVRLRAEDRDALAEIVKAARARSSSHSHDCAFIMTWDGPVPLSCDCGSDELRAALANLDKGKPNDS